MSCLRCIEVEVVGKSDGQIDKMEMEEPGRACVYVNEGHISPTSSCHVFS